ncbi:hypothetical protein Tco_1052230 [Tanacetum coccineum]
MLVKLMKKGSRKRICTSYGIMMVIGSSPQSLCLRYQATGCDEYARGYMQYCGSRKLEKGFSLGKLECSQGVITGESLALSVGVLVFGTMWANGEDMTCDNTEIGIWKAFEAQLMQLKKSYKSMNSQ